MPLQITHSLTRTCIVAECPSEGLKINFRGPCPHTPLDATLNTRLSMHALPSLIQTLRALWPHYNLVVGTHSAPPLHKSWIRHCRSYTRRAIYRIYLDFGPDCCRPFLQHAMHGLRLCIDLAVHACAFRERSTYVRAAFPMHAASILHCAEHFNFAAFAILTTKVQQGLEKWCSGPCSSSRTWHNCGSCYMYAPTHYCIFHCTHRITTDEDHVMRLNPSSSWMWELLCSVLIK